MTTSTKNKQQLGYTQLDTAEIVTILNRLLSNYMVYQQKLRKFYWNITGEDFFYLQENFLAMYEDAGKKTEKIAERIRLFGQTPLCTLAEYLDISTIKEDPVSKTSFEMAQILLSDINTLVNDMDQGIKSCFKIGDNGTEFMLKSFIFEIEREHWKLSAWLKQNY